ncbi:signal transduction histidine kinase [Maribacter vaceletii]|uniref:histidine kinase n=1 Tax=Maribacter vaceletii TaxID=1206816 RepID=A0A495E8Q0_9FLAO|nr:signal transduction histidine kinase [Maribacter vaceletii]
MSLVKKAFFCFVWLVLLSFNYVTSQDEKRLKFDQNYTLTDGLEHNGVTSILEDSKGYLWFGTYEGLNKFDGYAFKVYKNSVGQEVLASNRVRTITEDVKNNIWIGTDNGISVYNYLEEKFTTIYSNRNINKGVKGPIIRKILVNKEAKLVYCLTEGSGILVFTEDYKFSGHYEVPKEDKNIRIDFYDGLKINKRTYLLTTSNGLYSFDLKTNVFTKVLKNKIKYCNSIVKVSSSNLIVTTNLGVVHLTFDRNIKGEVSYKFKKRKFINEGFNSSSLDPLGNLWLGTLTNGIIHITNVERFLNNKPYKIATFNEKDNVIRTSAIASNIKSGCWVSTFNNGIYKFNLRETPFKKYHTKLNYPFGPLSNNITSITKFEDNKVLLTANRGGVVLFNIEKEEFEPLPFFMPNKYLVRGSHIYVDSKKCIWLKIAGIGIFKIKKGKVVKLENDLIDIKEPGHVRLIKEDIEGNIWIVNTESIYKIYLDDNRDILKIESLYDNPFFNKNKPSLFRALFLDPLKKYIWIGTDADGLYKLKLNNDKSLENAEVKQYINIKGDENSISSNFVTSILRLPNKELWLGTEGGGICKIENEAADLKFVSFTEKDGLSNNVVKALVADDENLWVATNKGLNKLDVTNRVVRNFSISDGLPFEDFWYVASMVNSKSLFFSGVNGFCYFNKDELPKKESLPILQLESLKIFNKKIIPGDTINGRVLLNKRLNEQKEINLKHDENVFSIDLASLHFLNPKNHHLKYKLLPTNKEWIETSSDQKSLYFNGLQPGEYELSVMASNSLNDWTASKNIKINIAPPFWKTIWAYLLYLLGILLVSYIVVLTLLKIQSLNHKVEIEHLEIENVKEINKAKLRFFSNISHELKTPLTLIASPVNILLERYKGNKDVSDKLQLVLRQSRKIRQLVTQVHDFQKSEANLLKMNYSRFSFNAFIEDLVSDFKFMADSDKKKLTVISPGNEIFISADKNKLEKVLNNLLSNAFKYTEPNDSITIDFRSDDKDLILSVKDTGRGIDKEDLEHVFKRFYQTKRQKNINLGGSGIGLAFTKRLVEMHYGYISVESEIDKGTDMKLVLPVVKQDGALEQEEKVEIILSEEKKFEFNTQIVKNNTQEKVLLKEDYSTVVVYFVEDNLDMRVFVTDVLTPYFKVKPFNNGKECLNAMEDEWPDIILSDVHMPEMNGLQLCNKIKSDMKTSHIPVILLTAFTKIEGHIQGLRDGADAYITKPFSVPFLITQIAMLLENRKQLRERYQIGIPLNKDNNKNNRNDNAFLEKLYNLMAENLDNQDLDINTFAKELYLNRTHFFQKVKSLTNQTPFELLKGYRLKKAGELILNKNVSINEVYVMTGFKSRTHFSKLFKEKFGVSPGKYSNSISPD